MVGLLALLVTGIGGQDTPINNNIDLPPKTEESIPQSNSPSRQDCHPSYSGCLNPSASDYDCAGGSGNGPYYTGRVQVTGPDVFDLDRDNDGWGCE